MENANQSKLEVAIDDYLQQLQEKGNYTSEDILELKNHLVDNVIELREKDLEDDEAFMIAKKRLGKEEILNVEFKKINGNRFINRELFILVLSICTYLFAYYFYIFVVSFIKQLAYYKVKYITLLGIVNYLFIIVFNSYIIYLVFNCKKHIRSAERLFTRSPANFSLTFIVLIVGAYILGGTNEKRFLKADVISSEEMTNRYESFVINHTFSIYLQATLGCLWILLILFSFIKSYKKVNVLEAIINSSGYVALFFVGLFWDGIAALARMLNGHNYSIISSSVFGITWLIGMFILNFYLRKNILVRNLVFILFGFVFELAAGIWINPLLKFGAPVSVYFIALVIGGTAGFAIANLIKRVIVKMAI